MTAISRASPPAFASRVTVYGFGERKTPRPFITACDKFVYFDVLGTAAPETEPLIAPARKAPRHAAAANALPSAVKSVAEKSPLDKAALDMLAKAVTASADDDGKANLARVGAHLAKQAPDFDARNYGFARLSELVEASGLVDVERVGDHPKIVMVKLNTPPQTT